MYELHCRAESSSYVCSKTKMESSRKNVILLMTKYKVLQNYKTAKMGVKITAHHKDNDTVNTMYTRGWVRVG